MFANDSNLAFQAETILQLEHQVNDVLESIHEWLRTNKLFVNSIKSEYMIIASDNRLSNIVQNPKFYLDNKLIRWVISTTRRIHNTEIMMYKIYYSKSTEYLHECYQNPSEVYHYEVRNSEI